MPATRWTSQFESGQRVCSKISIKICSYECAQLLTETEKQTDGSAQDAMQLESASFQAKDMTAVLECLDFLFANNEAA